MKPIKYALMGIGSICVIKLSYHLLKKVCTSAICFLHNRHTCLKLDPLDPKKEYAVVLGNGRYAEEYTYELLQSINVIVIHSNNGWAAEIKTHASPIVEIYKMQLLMYHIKDHYHTFLKLSNDIHIKSLINCNIERTQKLYYKLEKANKEEMLSTLESDLAFPLFAFYIIIKSMVQGKDAALIELVPSQQFQSVHSVTHGMMYEVWRQYMSSQFIYQKVLMSQDVKNTVRNSISKLGYSQLI